MAQEEPVIHAAAIKGTNTPVNSKFGVHRAPWIPGVIDPAARGRSQTDGKRLVEVYRGLGLDLEYADNSVEAGITEVWNRLSTGRLKVFRTLTNFFNEYRLYRRDKNGKIVKMGDHLMDAIRYDIMSGLSRAIPVRALQSNVIDEFGHLVGAGFNSGSSWMGA